jgi:aminoglycoside phosphotransferase (APT) family kinase protein
MDRTNSNAPADLETWLTEVTGDAGPFHLRRLAGGNSNETLLVESSTGQRRVLRRPPAATIAAGANDLAREHRVLTALHAAGAPVPQVLAPLADAEPLGPMILMEWIDGISLTDQLPASYGTESASRIGEALIDALVQIHSVDWNEAGLDGFGQPDGYLTRQVDRLGARYERQSVRPLPDADWLGTWLRDNMPTSPPPTVIHGDYHLDNTLFDPRAPALRVVIDFELSTLGDPLTDLGLLLAFWGERTAPIAMPRIQAVTRSADAPSRRALAERYEAASGRSVDDLAWYLAYAFWRLAGIVEGAYAQLVRGEADSEYARALETDVPALLAEARTFASGDV